MRQTKKSDGTKNRVMGQIETLEQDLAFSFRFHLTCSSPTTVKNSMPEDFVHEARLATVGSFSGRFIGCLNTSANAQKY